MTTTPLDEEDEFTEMINADLPRADMVKAGANGVNRWLVMKQDGEDAGLLDPEFIRGLIAKGEPEPETATVPAEDGPVTMTGSPGAIAAFIHKASQRAAAAPEDGVAKAEMSSKAINDLPDSAFAYIEPGGEKDADGKTTPRSKRHFPVHDAAHTRNALSRAPQSPYGDKAMPKIRAAAKKFGIDVAKAMAEAGIPEDVIKAMTSDATVTKDALVTDPDDGIDGMDPTAPLAAPDSDDAPGDPTDPGSPAWEAIDAATAQKWTAIAVRLKNALGILADRENLEALTADPDDAENAWDLQDAMCACDFVIDTLASFAVGEQAEADLATEAMAVSKAMAGFDTAPLELIEGLAPIAKAGRVLSAANEQQIRSAADSLQKVLASLPQAPLADDQVSKEAAMPAQTTETQDTPATEAQVAKEDAGAVTKAEDGQQDTAAPPADDAGHGGEVVKGGDDTGSSLPVIAWDKDGQPGMIAQGKVTKAQPGQIPVYSRAGAFVALVRPGEPMPIAKADGDAPAKPEQVAVYDSEGNLVGVADPADITPLSNVKAPAKNQDDSEAKPEDAKPADPADMTPAPSADAGTPADDDVTKAQDPGEAEAAPDDGQQARAVLKSLLGEALQEYLGAPGTAEGIAKQADVAELGAKVGDLLERVAKVEEQPAVPKVFTNGATPPPGTLRGQDRPGGQPQRVDVAKAMERKAELYAASGPEQARIAKEMESEAAAAYQALRAG